MTTVPFRAVKVFYADGAARSRNAASDAEAGGLSFGVAEVTVPSRHRSGRLERPSVWRCDFREQLSKHVMLRSAVAWPAARFFAHLRIALDVSGTHATLLFVHGCEDTLETALLRTAQIGIDLKLCPLLLYSWRASGTRSAYAVDVETVTRQVPILAGFIQDVSAISETKPIRLIARNLGKEALSSALKLATGQQCRDEHDAVLDRSAPGFRR